MRIKKGLKVALIASIAAMSFTPSVSYASTEENLSKIGTWDGAAETAELTGPYVDVSQQEILFGRRSFFQAPWRSYMDTWDGSRFLETLGVVFNMNRDEAEATAALLEEAGVRSARIEVGWDNLNYNDDTKFKDWNRTNVRMMVTALKKHHVRPIILLNLNSGMPNPNTDAKVTLTQPAAKGAREIYVSNPDAIKPKYTGFKGFGPAMFPIITEVDASTGKCTLSAPLPKDVPAGEQVMVKLKYQPFSGTKFGDGTENSASKETLDGWMQYVKTVTSAVKEDLATEGAADAGFDIEVYNEYTFGYHYLDINNYYDPDISFSKKISFSKDGKTMEGPEILLPMTADYVKNPENKLPGVNVISGFSNQRPYDNGTTMWPDQKGFSRHYYSGYDGVKAIITPESSSDFVAPTRLYNDALGNLDSTRSPTNQDQSVPGSYYIPPHVAALPEEWSFPYQTEMMIRDLQPFPGPFKDHFRYSTPGNGQMPELWMTESNYYRGGLSKEWLAASGATDKDPRFIEVMHHIGAKALLRMFTFYAHKGVHTINAYAIKSGDENFGILPEGFYEELKKNGYQLTDAARAKAGPQLTALKNISDLMKTGKKIDSPRPLEVTGLVEHKPQLVFAGDGTPEHPNRYNREDFAVLPYQLDSNKFAVGYYVVTRNAAHVWDESKDVLDTTRYDMPQQGFELSLKNVYGKGAKVSSYDPITNSTIPAQIIRSDESSLTVKVESVDYPRFLIIEEAAAGPVIGSPVLGKTGDGALLSFVPNVNGVAQVTYGDYPVRSGGTYHETAYSDTKFQTVKQEKEIESLDLKPSATPGSWKWTGTIVPEHSERYTFTVYSDNINNTKVKINGQPLDLNGTKGSGSIDLVAGKPYELEMTYFNEYNGAHLVKLFWSSASQDKAIVPAAVPDNKKFVIHTVKGQKVQLPIAGMQVGDGVKITFTSEEGISTRYPFWDYDAKAVLYPNTGYVTLDPAEPVTPTDPTDPTDPVTPPTDPTDPVTPPTDSTDPGTPPTDPTDPVTPPTDSTDPGTPTDSTDPGTPADPSDSGGSTDPVPGGSVPPADEIQIQDESVLLQEDSGYNTIPQQDDTLISLENDKIIKVLQKSSGITKVVLTVQDGSYTVKLSRDLKEEMNKKGARFVLSRNGLEASIERPGSLQNGNYNFKVRTSDSVPALPEGLSPISPQLELDTEAEWTLSTQPNNGSNVNLYSYHEKSGTWNYVKPNEVQEPGSYVLARSDKTFRDIGNHWGKADIERLAAKGFVSGYDNKEFKPDRQVNRAEFMAMLMRMVMKPDDKPSGPVAFTDVRTTDWFYREVSFGFKNGFVQGTEKGAFNPGSLITREEMFALAIRVLDKTSSMSISVSEQLKLLGTWKDQAQISGWAKETTAKAIQLGLVTGDGTGSIAPKKTATRAEAATILLRALDELEGK